MKMKKEIKNVNKYKLGGNINKLYFVFIWFVYCSKCWLYRLDNRLYKKTILLKVSPLKHEYNIFCYDINAYNKND